MTDYIVRATAAKGKIRAFAIRSTELVEKARCIHNTTPVVTAALGRLLSGAAMMGSMMKGDSDILTIRVKGDGPIGGILVTADSRGNVKGYPHNPLVMLPLKARGKLDVGRAVGKGFLNVTKDLGLKEPYSGECLLQSGEIGDDLAYYFTLSEQIPSAVGLGVLVDRDRTVKQAGGFIIQLMPGAEEEIIADLEKKVAGIGSVTSLMEEGLSPEQMLEKILGDEDLVLTDTLSAAFCCNCSRDRVRRALEALSLKDRRELADEGKPVEVRCDFCRSSYVFSPEELLHS